MGPPHVGGDGVSGDTTSFRAKMALAFAEALREAEAARAATASTTPPTQMAADAYKNLCFDFPLVDNDALEALALVIKSNLAVNGHIAFPVTPRFLGGLSHLARPVQRQQPGEIPSTAVQNDEGSAVGACNNPSVALATILSCVLVVAPAHALARAPSDSGAALRTYLGTYHAAAPSAVKPLDAESPVDVHEGPREEGGPHEVLSEEDDSDWEPLEDFPSGVEPPPVDPLLVPPDNGHTLTWEELMARLADLTSHIRNEALACDAVWADPTLRLAPAVVDLLQGLQASARKYGVPVAPVQRTYLSLLVERLAADPAGGGSVGIATVVPQVLAALNPPLPGQPALAPAFLSSLVERLGPARPRASALLWPAVHEALPLLGAQAQALAADAERSHDWLADLEALMRVLAFYVEAAPGNADIGPPLLQSGLFRDSLALFAAAAAAPPAELLRRFLLLACAACPALTRYAAAVPPFTAATAAEAFRDTRGPASLHAAVWPLLLRRTAPPAEAEESAAALVLEPGRAGSDDENPDAIALAGALGRLRRFLSLLQAVVRVAPGGRAVWAQGGPLEKALAQCAAMLRGMQASWTGQDKPPVNASAELANRTTEATKEGRKVCHYENDVIGKNDGQGLPQGGQPMRSPSRELREADKSTAEDKVRDVLPAVLKQLKDLVGLSKEGISGKSD